MCTPRPGLYRRRCEHANIVEVAPGVVDPITTALQLGFYVLFAMSVWQFIRHRGPLESSPADFATSPEDRRHAECADCHDVHVASHDRPGSPAAPTLSRRNLGVSRVLVQNGGPGTRPPVHWRR